MRKIIVTCHSCGQRMQVSRSALGKTGKCTSCGTLIPISADNASAARPSSRGRVLRGHADAYGATQEPTEEAKVRFAKAVELFARHQYAEALAIFDGLAMEYPGNPDIENGRVQCMAAISRPSLGAPSGQSATRLPDGARLDRATVKRVVLEKLLTGSNESIQLQAAEIAGKILGMTEADMSQARKDHADDDDAATADE